MLSQESNGPEIMERLHVFALERKMMDLLLFGETVTQAELGTRLGTPELCSSTKRWLRRICRHSSERCRDPQTTTVFRGIDQ